MSAVADVRPALIGHLKDLHLPTVRDCYEDTGEPFMPHHIVEAVKEQLAGKTKLSVPMHEIMV